MRNLPNPVVPFTPLAWFFRVGNAVDDGDATAYQLYSTAARAFVAEDDPAFAAFTTRGALATVVRNEGELLSALELHGVPLPL